MSLSVSGRSLKSFLKSSLLDLYVGFSICARGPEDSLTLYQDEVFFFFSRSLEDLSLLFRGSERSKLRHMGSNRSLGPPMGSGLGLRTTTAPSVLAGACTERPPEESEARSSEPWLS
ncbi:unnamed protein product, partial [Ixodes pacificus]